MESDLKLSAQGLVRDYAGVRAVDGVDIDLAGGEILGLLGPNGAGKSTTLRMLAGTLAPTAGRIALAGFDLHRDPLRAKRQLGYLPERPPVYPELSVDEYLRFCARLHGVPKKHSAAAIAQVKRDCGLEEVGARLIGHLSKGFQQRVGIAQAIVHRPEVVILDEPTAGLDPNQLRGIRALIAQLATEHSVVISSHILSEIQAVATRVMILHMGRVVLDEPLSQAPVGETITLELGHSPDLAEIEALPGVAQAYPTGARRWRLVARDGRDIRAAVAEAVVQRRWPLLALSVGTPGLEERFAALTQRRPDDAPEAPA